MTDKNPPVTHEILTYLVEHPDAQDTLEGIAEWWILEQRILRQLSEVRKAVEELVDQRFLIEQTGADSRVRYRINRQELLEIKAFLKSKDRP